MYFGTHPDHPLPPITEWPKQKAWSYSAVSSHAKCPLQFRFRRIDRLPEPPSEAMSRGTVIHADLSDYINTGNFPDTSTVSQLWRPFLDGLRALGARSELQVAFDKDWVALPAWYGEAVHARVVFDAMHHVDKSAFVTEFKTGKVYPEHVQQGRLYCLAALMLQPEAEEASCQIVYIDQGPGTKRPIFTQQRSAVPQLLREFEDFSKDFLNDTIYPARPGYHCNWCAYSKAKGGPCTQGA